VVYLFSLIGYQAEMQNSALIQMCTRNESQSWTIDLATKSTRKEKPQTQQVEN